MRSSALTATFARPKVWLHALRRPFNRPTAVPAAAVEQVVRDLESLNSRTEHDFLAAGDRLLEIRSAARALCAGTRELTGLISCDEARAASQALARILELSSALRAQIERNCQSLGSVRADSTRVRQSFAGLRNTVSIFRTLCTLTRIETSQLGDSGAGFGDVAEEARPLSESIQASGEGVLEASARLDREVEAALASAAGLWDKQLRDLPVLVDGVKLCLDAFEERRENARLAAGRQTEEYAAISGAVDDMVGCLQFHDITRQQIEHVVEALRHLARDARTGLPREAPSVLSLQSSQLAGAAGVFASSVDRAANALAGMAARVQEVSAEGRSLMGDSAGEQDSFFLDMESRFTRILEMLANCTGAHAEMARNAGSLETTIAAMSDSVARIREIETRIERIAINAVIRAVHLGRAGDGLNVIAEIMGRLAVDSSRHTGEASLALDAMRAAAREVRESGSSPAAGGLSGVTEVVAEMRRAILDLHTSGERSFSRVSGIAAAGDQLVKNIGALRDGFTAGELFAGVTAKARADLDALAGPAASRPAARSDLDHLAGRYTMQTERDVHAALTADAPSPAVSASLGGNDLGDNDLGGNDLGGNDLGDNVELF